MYVCRHCGYVSHNESINYCNNIRCRYYGYHDAGEDVQPPNAAQPMPRPTPTPMPMPTGQPPRPMPSMPMPMSMPMPTGQPPRPMPTPMPMPPVENTKCFAMPEFKNNVMLGLATVPFQVFGETYSIKDALRTGTLFPALDMPYTKSIIRRG